MNNQVNVCIRYAADLPVLRYIVPFSYAHNDMSYDDAKKKILATNKWVIGKRKDLVPSREEDLYDHVYDSLIDDAKTSLYDTNIGMFFIPKEPNPQNLIYSFYDGSEKKYEFSISDVNIFIFKTGVGLYVYEATLPQHEHVEDGYIKSLNLEQLILFQNRFKELNVIRGYFGKSENKYCFYPKGYDEHEFYVIGNDIAKKLTSILGDIFYYPPRVNAILKHQKLFELKEEKEKLKQNRQKINKKKFEKREAFWTNITVSDLKTMEMEDSENIFIVPDKALLYSYVAMNTTDNLTNEEDKEIALSQFCKSLYYLTRGYKPSYRVSANATDERAQMFRRHENDFWDASLEGVGDFVLIYDNLFDSIPGTNLPNTSKQKTSLFFDSVRPLEMRGDYFILYVLLLYQHYSVVFFSKNITETIPMQKNVFLNASKDSAIIYDKLRDLKLDVDMFFANCMFESVGQITDVCTIYSFIENKMHVKKNIESLQRGINDLDALREEIQNKQKEEQDSHTNKLLTTIGILAIVSIIVDSIELLDKITPLFKKIWTSVVSLGPNIQLIIGIVIAFLLLVVSTFIFKKRRG